MFKKLITILISVLSLLAFISCPPPNTGNDEDGNGGGETSLSELIIGYWVEDSFTFPDSVVMSFAANNIFSQFDDYACTQPSFPDLTWLLEGNKLYIDDVPYAKIVKINNNEAELYDPDFGFHFATYYRKGTEPGGYAFALTLTKLLLGADYTESTLPPGSGKLFSFDATIDTLYDIYWDDWNGSGSYPDCGLLVYTYESDQITPYFEWGYYGDYYHNPAIIQVNDILVYTVVRGIDESLSGNFAIKVEEMPSIAGPYTELTVGNPAFTEGSIAAGETALFGFNASNGVDYDIYWDDWIISGNYTCVVKVSAFREDGKTCYFFDYDFSDPIPTLLTATGDELVYILVRGWDEWEAGTFGVRIEETH